MKYFENKNIEKAYQKILNVLYVGLFLLALGIVLFGYSIFKSEEVKPTLLDDIIVNNPVENAYGYIDIISEPVLFAEYGEGEKKAYFVEDEEYLYVVEMNDQKYSEIVSKEYPVRVEGSTVWADDDLKEIAIETLNESLDSENQLLVSDYDDIFGPLTLDLNTTPLFMNDWILIIGLVLGVIALILLLAFFLSKIRYQRSLKKMSFEEKEKIKKEINDEKKAFYYKKANMYLTENYIINLANRFEAIPYKDIVWMYPYTLRYYGMKTYQSIMLVTKDKKNHTVCYMNVLTKTNKEIYQEIYETILNKNSKILNGFTKENKEKMKEITSKKAS